MKHKLFIVTLLVVMGIGSVIAQSSRRIQRIDREIQKTVFIPKGTWMAGGTVSYSEHNESNLNFLVLKDIEGKGYDFSVSPYFGYFSGIIFLWVPASLTNGIIWIWVISI